MHLAGRWALVTGAGGGNGPRVVTRPEYDRAKITTAETELDAIGADAPPCGDLADTACCHARPGEAAATFGGLDIKVDHAGILRHADITRTTDEDFALARTGNSVDGGRMAKLSLP